MYEFQIRESPDGENSSTLEAMAKCASRNDTACGFPADMTEEVVDPETEVKTTEKLAKPVEVVKSVQDKPKDKSKTGDIVREYVMQEEIIKRVPKRKSRLPIKFKDLKPASVAKNRAKFNKKSKSKSTENLFDKYRKRSTESLLERYTAHNKNDTKSQSVSRLPTLSAFDEERIIWMKSYEDDIAMEQERRARTVLSR